MAMQMNSNRRLDSQICAADHNGMKVAVINLYAVLWSRFRSFCQTQASYLNRRMCLLLYAVSRFRPIKLGGRSTCKRIIAEHPAAVLPVVAASTPFQRRRQRQRWHRRQCRQEATSQVRQAVRPRLASLRPWSGHRPADGYKRATASGCGPRSPRRWIVEEGQHAGRWRRIRSNFVTDWFGMAGCGWMSDADY